MPRERAARFVAIYFARYKMTRAYYNEHDPFCAAWLYNLIQQNFIAPGDIDTRDIRDIKPIDLRNYTQHHFFAGIGGWSLALRLAGVGDHEAVWTGSCPCQPFSAAGKRGGFADERHLWPSFYHLVTQCRPPVLFGEQVASASDWLRLVRGDLEALDYAVGTIPIEAASAGADHLRDRFWFVADDGFGRCDGSREGQVELARRAEIERAGDSNPVANAASEREHGARYARSGGRNEYTNCCEPSLPLPNDVRLRMSRTPEWDRVMQRALSNPQFESGALSRLPGAFSHNSHGSLADSDFAQRWFGNQQPAGQFPEQQSDTSARTGSDMADCESCVGRLSDVGRQDDLESVRASEEYQWVLGADGKARRVKPGVRLLVDGFPNRVGLLRGFGNAIDPRPASKFIQAWRESKTMISAALAETPEIP